jgi:hypothetical protein
MRNENRRGARQLGEVTVGGRTHQARGQADAIDSDAALDMMLLGGREIAGFLLFHEVGIDEDGLNVNALRAWAAQFA